MAENIIVQGNTLIFKGKKYKCAIGKNGYSNNKKEGDNCTPIGTFPIHQLYYREDKISVPDSILETIVTQKDFGWCDAVDDKNYNKFVNTPYPASHEKLWREDDVYNICVVLGYNDNPPVKGIGSAIFMHLAKPNYAGTEGCIALNEFDMREVLKNIKSETAIEILGA